MLRLVANKYKKSGADEKNQRASEREVFFKKNFNINGGQIEKYEEPIQLNNRKIPT